MKITQISDFHSNKLINLTKLKTKIKEFDPDVIVLTGDIIDRNDKELDTVIDFLENIVSLNKDILYIRGNHEKYHPLYEEFKEKMEGLNINVLENESVEITIGDNRVNFIGLDFFKKSEEHNEIVSYEKSIENTDTNNYNIILRHSSKDVERILKGDEDLILSGHTHGGQVRLPIIGPIIAPGQGFFPKYDKGIFDMEDTLLYIDSGIGNSKLPIRAFNPVQYSNIIISAEN